MIYAARNNPIQWTIRNKSTCDTINNRVCICERVVERRSTGAHKSGGAAPGRKRRPGTRPGPSPCLRSAPMSNNGGHKAAGVVERGGRSLGAQASGLRPPRGAWRFNRSLRMAVTGVRFVVIVYWCFGWWIAVVVWLLAKFRWFGIMHNVYALLIYKYFLNIKIDS